MKLLFAFYVITCAHAGAVCKADNLMSFESLSQCEAFRSHFGLHYEARFPFVIDRTNCERIK